MKKVLIIVLMLVLSLGLIGCSDDEDPNGDNLNVVWEEFSSDFIVVPYPVDWIYKYDEFILNGEIESVEVAFFDETKSFDFSMEMRTLDEAEEEFLDDFKKMIEKEKEEAEEDDNFDVISDREFILNGQQAFEFEVVWRSVYDYVTDEPNEPKETTYGEWMKGKGVITTYKGAGVFIEYLTPEEDYNKNIGIVDYMIKNIKFVN